MKATIALLIISLPSLFLLRAGNAEQQTSGVKIIAPNPQASGPPRKNLANPSGGFRYAIVGQDKAIIYADGAIVVAQGEQKKSYPRGTLLVSIGKEVSVLGVVRPAVIGNALAAGGIEKQLAENVASAIRRQPSAGAISCTKNSISVFVLSMMGSSVGSSAGMSLVLNSTMYVSIPECVFN